MSPCEILGLIKESPRTGIHLFICNLGVSSTNYTLLREGLNADDRSLRSMLHIIYAISGNCEEPRGNTFRKP